MKEKFRQLSTKVSVLAGSPAVFFGAVFVVFVWAFSGTFFDYSDTWQLVINTGTTIATFLMVFLIQNTQNRDSRAIQLKLDELIRSNKKARDSFMSLEDISDNDLQEITEQFRKLHEESTTTAAMRKLHKKLEEEHAKRFSLKGATEKVVGAVLDPFAHSEKK